MKTETITIEASKIKPNPFKKFINKGKLNQEVIAQLIEGYKQTTFHENLAGRRNKNGEIELIYGHHRLEAVKKVYGNNHKIKINVYSYKDFSDDKMLMDMVRENVTQRGDNFKDMLDSVILTKSFLEGKFQTSNQVASSKKTHKKEITAGDIARFLSANDKAISRSQVLKYLMIKNNLSPEIKLQIDKGDRAGKIDDDKIGLEVASKLAEFKMKEQKYLLRAIQKSDLNKDKIKSNLTKLKTSKEIKEKVKSGKIEFKDIPIEALKSEIKQKQEEAEAKDDKKIIVTEYKKYLRDAENKIADTNVKIFQTCAYLDGLEQSGVLYELDWKALNKIIDEAEKFGDSYSKFVKKIRTAI